MCRLECYVKTERKDSLVRVVVSVDIFRIEADTVLCHAGEDTEIVTGEVDSDLLDVNLLCEGLRKSVAEGDVLEADVADILEITGVGSPELNAAVVHRV